MVDQIGDSEPDMDPVSAAQMTNTTSPAATNDDGTENDMAPIPGQGMPNKMKTGSEGTSAALRLLGAGQPYSSHN